MEKKQYKKSCTQVTIPEVDNSSPCKDFNWTECITVNMDSKIVRLPSDSNLNEYLLLLENQIAKMQNTIVLLKRKVDSLQECCASNQSSGIGIF